MIIYRTKTPYQKSIDIYNYSTGRGEEGHMGNLFSSSRSTSTATIRTTTAPNPITRPPRQLPAATVNSVDDLNFSMVLLNSLDDDHHDQVKGEISEDARYAEQLSLQEALLMSAANSHMPTFAVNYGSSINNIQGNRSSTSYDSRQLPHLKDVPREEAAGASGSRVRDRDGDGGGSSHQSFCGICLEAGKQSKEMFKNPNCPHTFCSDCIRRHIMAKIQDNIIIVTCPQPNCKATLEPHICKGIIPGKVFDRWGDALCESTILGSQKLYCPFTDCSGPLENDGGGAAGPAGVLITIRETECLHCRRLFCAQCKVPWHSGIQCEDFQRLNKDERGETDLMLRSLAKKKNWGRCPNCKYYVDKKDGCLHITCRCKYEFCYRCGERWAEGHGGCR